MDAPPDRVVELEVRSAQELRKVTTLQAKASVRRKIGACLRRIHFGIRATNSAETQVGRRQGFRKFALAGCAGEK